MNWPTGPPRMPSAGWYSDPEEDSAWRWWDGTAWTERRSPKWARPTPGPPTFSRWFDRSVRCVGWVIRRVGIAVFGVWIAIGSLAAVVAVAAFESDRGRELRGLIDDDLAAGGSSVLTDAEVDRAWELVASLFWSVLPWVIVISVAYVVATAWAYALAAQVAMTTPDDTASDTASAALDETKPTMRSALRRTPVVIAAWIVLVAIGLGVFAAVSLPVVLVVVGDAGGAAIGLTAFFSVIAAIVVGAWLWVRLGLTIVLAALGGQGLGIQGSWSLTHDRYWFVFVRLLMAALITGVIGGAANLVGNFFGFFGLVVGVTVVLVLGLVVDAVRRIVSASTAVVIVAQIDESSRQTGSSAPSGPA